METVRLPDERTAVAPDGSDVRVLVSLPGASVAHFSLAPGEVSIAVRHLTVDEAWYVVGGRGTIWRMAGGASREDPLEAGVCLTIPCGTAFQFRSAADAALAVVGVTIPPWPLERVEAVEAGVQRWAPTLAAGPGLGRV